MTDLLALAEACERAGAGGLDPDVLAILREIAEHPSNAPSVPKSPARDKAKRLGLIRSTPPNPSGLRAKAGRGHRWRFTDAGLAALRAHHAAAADDGAGR
jgi:hypothetical protein